MVSESFFLYFSLDPTSAFAVYGATPTNKSPTVVFPPSAVKLNIGGHYNTTTGKYTCHYQGIYVFSLNLYKKSTANYVYCYIRKNGSVHAVARVASDSEYGFYESSASTVLRLTRGDTVDVGSCSNPGNIDGRTSFIGFLLKAD